VISALARDTVGAPPMTTTLMEQEIYEQPDVLRALLRAGAEAAREAAAALASAQPAWLLIAARGSSDNAARYAQYLFGVRHRLAVALAAPSLRGAAVLALSQSGQSPDIVACVEAAAAQGVPSLALTNDAASPLAAAAARLVLLHAGDERAVAATKTYTATLLALGMISVELAGEPPAALASVPEWIERTLAARDAVRRAASGAREAAQLLVVARGFNYATAHELALKIKETSYLPAAAYSVADLLHGPVAAVDAQTTAVVIAPSGRALASARAAVGELCARGARVVVISDDTTLASAAAGFVPLPGGLPEWLSPLSAAVASQLFAHDLALELGRDPDRPRGLNKVTRTH
jgi:glucosamine--fructose-6-phosphate aminotransferase (isomerizing)